MALNQEIKRGILLFQNIFQNHVIYKEPKNQEDNKKVDEKNPIKVFKSIEGDLFPFSFSSLELQIDKQLGIIEELDKT